MEKQRLNKFLQSRNEINACTQLLKDNNLIESGLDCKNFDIAHVVPYMKDGDNMVDLGSNGSYILQNAVKLNYSGRKVGIDLGAPEYAPTGNIEYFKGDLMNTPFESNSFDLVTCLSVIEHSVDYSLLAKESSRLLKVGGQLIVSCDYWNPKPDTSLTKLYSLDWNILDKNDVLRLVNEMSKVGLNITSDIDWTTSEAVINPQYCSPVAGVSYSFGIFHFIKQ